jgi:hypothetical protein
MKQSSKILILNLEIFEFILVAELSSKVQKDLNSTRQFWNGLNATCQKLKNSSISEKTCNLSGSKNGQ